MVDEKKEYTKTRTLNFEEVKGLVNKYGKIIVKDFPTNTNIVVEIVGPIQSDSYEWNDITKTVFNLPIKYKAEEMLEAAPLTLQVGESAAQRLDEDYPNNTYVGMMAYITKTVYQGKFPQFINPFTPSSNIIDKDKLFAVIDAQNPIKKIESEVKNELDDLEDNPVQFKLTDAENDTIMSCKLLVEQKRGTDTSFKGLNADQWTKLLIKKGFKEDRAKIIVAAIPKDLEVC